MRNKHGQRDLPFETLLSPEQYDILSHFLPSGVSLQRGPSKRGSCELAKLQGHDGAEHATEKGSLEEISSKKPKVDPLSRVAELPREDVITLLKKILLRIKETRLYEDFTTVGKSKMAVNRDQILKLWEKIEQKIMHRQYHAINEFDQELKHFLQEYHLNNMSRFVHNSWIAFLLKVTENQKIIFIKAQTRQKNQDKAENQVKHQSSKKNQKKSLNIQSKAQTSSKTQLNPGQKVIKNVNVDFSAKKQNKTAKQSQQTPKKDIQKQKEEKIQSAICKAADIATKFRAQTHQSQVEIFRSLQMEDQPAVDIKNLDMKSLLFVESEITKLSELNAKQVMIKNVSKGSFELEVTDSDN